MLHSLRSIASSKLGSVGATASSTGLLPVPTTRNVATNTLMPSTALTPAQPES